MRGRKWILYLQNDTSLESYAITGDLTLRTELFLDYFKNRNSRHPLRKRSIRAKIIENLVIQYFQ